MVIINYKILKEKYFFFDIKALQFRTIKINPKNLMEIPNQNKRINNLKLNKNSVLLFDMDGTLIETDFANFLSYKEAILSIIQTDKDIEYNPSERLNREKIKKLFPNFSPIELDIIVKQKEKNYKINLNKTKLIKSVVDVLIKYSKTNKTVLVTNCREDRALMTLNYHNLTNKFSHLFFRQISDKGNRINKYENALKHLKLSAQNMIVFENEEDEINDAILVGIDINNIIKL